MNTILRLATLLVLTAPIITGCGSDARDEVQKDQPPTLDEVYQGMRTSALRDGYILHGAAAASEAFGDTRLEGSYEVWLDLSNDQARQEWRYSGQPDETDILHGSRAWVVGRDWNPSGAPACLGRYDQPLCTLLGVAMVDAAPTESDYGGRPVVDVPRQTVLDLDGEKWDLDEHAYLDPDTLLPVAVTSSKVPKDNANLNNVSLLLQFSTFEWLPAGSLPANFFDPGEDTDPAKGLRNQSMDVFWLGRDVTSNGNLPALSLQIGGPDDANGVYLVYDDARQFGWNRLSLSEQPSDHFVDLEPPWSDSPCTTRTEVAIPDGKAVVYSKDAYLVPGLAPTPGPCPADEPRLFVAHVWLTGTAISISALTDDDNPWNSEEGMRQAIRSLVPFAD